MSANPYLPLWEHLPDGEPRVFEDPDDPGKLRIYIIGSHDVRGGSYCGPDIRAWSAPVENLNDWRDEGPIFSYQADGLWDIMYAPDLVCVKKNNGKKEYYLYPHSRGTNREAMVAKGTSPIGPFTPINLTIDGKSAVSGSIMGFDPAVFIEYITDPNDPDYEIGFRAYGYWGFQRSFAAELDQNTMYSLKPGTEIIRHFIPASSSYGVIRDPEGTAYPFVYPDEDLGRFNFFEAASIRKAGNKYIWVYSGYSGPEYGLSSTNSALRYAYGDTPLGPWRSGGVLIDSRAPVINQDGSALQESYGGHNTHGSIEMINGRWYVFYHRAPRGFGFARQPMVAPINVLWDEKPVALGGRVYISAYDPYAGLKTGVVEKTKQMPSYGITQSYRYTGAEVTSEGFNIYGLKPYKYYSAGIACYLSRSHIQSDSFDIWDDNAPITSVENGDIIGYKYFGFSGLEKDSCGIKAFEGISGDTLFNLYLTPKSKESFRINIWVDGPWDNDAWKGKKIGEINVPAGSDEANTRFYADISASIDFLTDKRAIYLAAEGGAGSLFDLEGLGFSRKGIDLPPLVAPSIVITVNGEIIDLPKTPVKSTEQNGITGYDLYETKCKVSNKTDEAPLVTASCDNPDVIISITNPSKKGETAIIRCKYKNMIKTYHVSFLNEERGL